MTETPKESYEKVFSSLETHHKWFENSIPLIASENIPSPAVREAVMSDFGNRYAEGWPGERVYAGCTYIDEVETQCMELAQNLFNAEFADVRAVSGVVANCPGTGTLLAKIHQNLPPLLVSHNGAHETRMRPSHENGVGAAIVGSLRQYKGMQTVAEAAALCGTPMTVIGAATSKEAEQLIAKSAGHLSVELAVAHHLVPDRLTQFRTLVLPLSGGLFGEQLTSPLKLWDYLASGVPIVAADLPSVMDAAPGALYPYTPEDPASLADAIDRVSTDQRIRAQLLAAAVPRTWRMRAEEVTAFVSSVLDKS